MCVYACTYIRTYVCVCMCVYACMYVRTYVCVCVCVYVCVCMYVRTYVCGGRGEASKRNKKHHNGIFSLCFSEVVGFEFPLLQHIQ